MLERYLTETLTKHFGHFVENLDSDQVRLSAWKGEMDISVGNVIGSNIFNVLFVLGICPMIKPIMIEPRVLSLDFPIMLGFCALLVGLLTMVPPRLQLDRKRGVLLLGAYLLFVVSLFQ